MIRNYILIALRSLLKNKVVLCINFLGLGIAIACCIVAYLNWDFSTNFDKHHVNAGTIYRVQAWQDYQGERNRYAIVPNALGKIVKQNFNDVDNTVRYTTANSDIRIGDEVFNTAVSYADSAFFDLFTFTLKDGTYTSFYNKGTIFISDELARKYFNNSEDVVGKQITQINHGKPKEFIVGGIFETQPLNSSFPFEAITLWDNYWDTTEDGQALDADWKNMDASLFIQIKDPSKVESIRQRLQQYVGPQNIAREDLQLKEYYLQNFKTLAAEFYGDTWLIGERLRWGLSPSSVIAPCFMAIALLLLACFNFTNTTVAIAGKRLKEIGIRKAMGGLRKQLVIQFLSESMIMCFFGLFVGVLLAEILVPAYNSLWPGIKLKLSYSENISFSVFLIALLMLTALIAGTYPAFYISSFKPIAILKGKIKFAGTNWFTRTLLTFQFSIVLICIVSAVAFIRNAQYQRDYDLGYRKNGVIIASIGSESEFNNYRNALMTNKDIKVISGSKDHVSDNYYKAPVKYENTDHQVEIVDVGDDYLQAMDISLISGRDFRKDSKNDQNESVIVTEEFVKQFGIRGNPVGKRLLLSNTEHLFIIGVIKNILTNGYWKPVQPVMLRYVGPDKYTQILVSTSSENLLSVNHFMKEEWKKISPNTIYSGDYMDGNIRSSQMINNNVVKIFSFLGVIAVLMSVTGLYAMVSLNIIKRMKEIGIRKVLGASAGSIALVINKEFAIILTAATVLGGAGGYFFTDGIMDAIWEYYLKINSITVAIAAASMFGVAVITVGYKTIITAFMNPVNTLRDE